MLSIRIKQPVSIWTESDTCSGRRSIKSGVTNTSAVMSATSTSCLFPYSIFLLLPSLRPLLSGSTEDQAKNTHMLTQSPSANPKVNALPRWMTTPLHRSHPVIADHLHLSLQVAATLRHLSCSVTALLPLAHPTTAVLLPRSRPVTVAPHHLKMGLNHVRISRSTATCQFHFQKAWRKLNCEKEAKMTRR